jgi:hypothetical protein
LFVTWYHATTAFTNVNSLKTVLPVPRSLKKLVEAKDGFQKRYILVFRRAGSNSMQIMQFQAKRRKTMADDDGDDDDDDDDPVAKFIAKAFILIVGSITIYKCLAFLVLVAKAFYESASLAGWLK